MRVSFLVREAGQLRAHALACTPLAENSSLTLEFSECRGLNRDFKSFPPRT